MIDLNRIGAGRKLIKEVISTNKSNNAPWSKLKQIEKQNKHKNIKRSDSK